MADTFSKSRRSQIMRSVRSSGTSAEIRCEHLLRISRIRFRKHPMNLPGRPDFVLPGSRVVIFVHGCFWHGHEGCKHSSLPSSNVEYWVEKIGKNQRRDRKVRRSLRKAGWRTAVLWECKLRDAESVTRRLLKLSQLPCAREKFR
jgi:DNA mismatch endonuclease (patch repair protein)